VCSVGVNELHKINRLRLEKPAVVDVMRPAIKQIKEIFLQRLVASSRLGRERTAGGFGDTVNLENDHEGLSCHRRSPCMRYLTPTIEQAFRYPRAANSRNRCAASRDIARPWPKTAASKVRPASREMLINSASRSSATILGPA
jgi:hypothetical protein